MVKGHPIVSDSALVHRAAAGDAIAFSELVTRHYANALQILTVLCNDDETAGGVLDEAFARVGLHIQNIEGAAHFRMMLYRAAITLARRLPNPGHAWLATINKESCATRLSTLSFDERAALLLRELAHLGYEEIAGALRCREERIPELLRVSREALVEKELHEEELAPPILLPERQQ